MIRSGGKCILKSFRRVALVSALFSLAAASAGQTSPTTETVQEILDRPAVGLDYLDAAATFDRLIDKGSDTAATGQMVARLVDAARQMAGPKPTDAYKLAAVRQAIYVAGAWNYGRPFSYDLDDPLGQRLQNRLLSTYIRTRKGNCVSMPTLFLIVADRMGLNVHLATAPLHLFVRYTDPNGLEHNLETTSGGHEARTEWYRENLPMTDRAIQSGIYMRTLSKGETIAEMATVVMDFLIEAQRYQEAIDVADVILAASPRDAYTMVRKGSAIGGLMRGGVYQQVCQRGSDPSSATRSLPEARGGQPQGVQRCGSTGLARDCRSAVTGTYLSSRNARGRLRWTERHGTEFRDAVGEARSPEAPPPPPAASLAEARPCFAGLPLPRHSGPGKTTRQTATN